MLYSKLHCQKGFNSILFSYKIAPVLQGMLSLALGIHRSITSIRNLPGLAAL